MSQSSDLAAAFATVINDVDATIGENRNYGEGIGPHHEDDQIDALVDVVRDEGLFEGSIATAKADASEVRYPNGQSADLVLDTPDTTEYCEAKLFRFQKANEQPSSRGFSKVFNPFQDRNPRSFIHDVSKLGDADIRAAKTLLGIYYRPVNGAGTDITSEQIAQKFVTEVEQWTDQTIEIDTVAKFDSLQHPVHTRGAIIVWQLSDQPTQYF